MKAPLSLPWFASQAGVSTERALTLWQQAVETTAQDSSADYWQQVNERFIALLKQEKGATYRPALASTLRNRNRLLRMPLTALEDMLLIACRLQRQPVHHHNDGHKRHAA